MKKFGTFSGVFVPSFEAIFGAVLFLILPYLVAEVGVYSMFLIIILANTLTVSTTFSIADCTTNLETVDAGGMYAVSKRSLGKAFGGSIGIQLFLAQAASIGFYAIGFADPLQEILVQVPFIEAFVHQNNLSILTQKQIIATVFALTGFIASLVGADFVSKLQLLIFFILIVSIGTIIISPLLGIKTAVGPLYDSGMNWGGLGISGMGFWLAFTTFFPAVTGIDAGVGMSGSLKDPRRSLAKGTFFAIAITLAGYLLITLVFGLMNPDVLAIRGNIRPTAVNAFASVSWIRSILIVGILFATGSSALAYFITSPRTAQALANDKLLPKALQFLGRDFKKDGLEPRFASILTFFIVILVIWSGDVSFSSMLVGIAFLVVYGWVNLAAFFERISGNPSFRPTNKGHWLISLYGFCLAMMVIVLFNWKVGIAVFSTQILIFYLLLKYKSNNRLEGVWWGLNFSLLTAGFKRMRRIIQGSKNWRPIVGVFCFADKIQEFDDSLAMAKSISEYKGLTMINVLRTEKMPINEVIFHELSIEPKDTSFSILLTAEVSHLSLTPVQSFQYKLFTANRKKEKLTPWSGLVDIKDNDKTRISIKGVKPNKFQDNYVLKVWTVEEDGRVSKYFSTITFHISHNLHRASIIDSEQLAHDNTLNLLTNANTIQCSESTFENSIKAICQASIPGNLDMNTAMLPLDDRLNLISLVTDLMELRKNILLYKRGSIADSGSNRIDVWWKGKENGNFMALLSYIITLSDLKNGLPRKNIRVLRKLFKNEDESTARKEMKGLLRRARLRGDVEILMDDDKTFMETLRDFSSDASLILLGMPGKPAKGLAKVFALDKLFFSKELAQFKHLPPILFVKAADTMELIEE